MRVLRDRLQHLDFVYVSPTPFPNNIEWTSMYFYRDDVVANRVIDLNRKL